MAQEAFYLNLGLPVYVKTTSREAFQNAVVQEGHILLFSQDGKKLIGKTSSGDYIEIGSNSFDFSAATATASDALASKTFWNSQGVLTTGNIPTVTAVLEGNKVIIPRGYISDSTSITVSGGADIQAGYIDANGNFQPLSFNGTTASDSGSAVSGLSHAIFNTGHAEPAYPQGGGGGTDFYKCTSVYTPQPYFLVANGPSSIAGDSVDLDGKYQLTTQTYASKPVYMRYAPGYGYYWIAYYDSSQYILWTETSYWQFDHILCFRQGNDPWYDVNDYEIALTATLVSGESDSTKEWTGRKAILNNGVYSFQSDSTSGLTYSVVTPVVGKTYSADALVSAELYEGLPVSGLVFYAALQHAVNTAETGQAIGSLTDSLTYQIYKGVPCVYFASDNSAGIYCRDVTGFPSGQGARTLSIWMNPSGNSGNSAAIFSYGENAANCRYALGINDISSIGIWGHSNTTTYSHSFTVGQWVHICVTFVDGAENVYVNGQRIGSQNHLGLTTHPIEAMIGNDAGESSPTYAKTYVYLAAARLYNRVLQDIQIQALANQFHPTA